MIFCKLLQWRIKRGLDKVKYDKAKQAGNIAEELSELLLSTTEEQEIDAFADLIIYSINAIEIAGYNSREVLEEVIQEIESREGIVIDGKFHKSSVAKLYKAKIKECKRCQQ